VSSSPGRPERHPGDGAGLVDRQADDQEDDDGDDDDDGDVAASEHLLTGRERRRVASIPGCRRVRQRLSYLHIEYFDA